MYHTFFSHQYINNTLCIDTYIYIKQRDRATFNKSFLDYLTYNKNGLHYKVKVVFFFISQIKIYWLNVCIIYFCQIKTSSGRWKGEASSICLWWEGGGGQKILQIASWWTLVSNEFEECHAFCKLETPSVNFDQIR